MGTQPYPNDYLERNAAESPAGLLGYFASVACRVTSRR